MDGHHGEHGVEGRIVKRQTGHVCNNLIFGKTPILKNVDSVSRSAQPFANELVPVTAANVEAAASHFFRDIIEPFRGKRCQTPSIVVKKREGTQGEAHEVDKFLQLRAGFPGHGVLCFLT